MERWKSSVVLALAGMLAALAVPAQGLASSEACPPGQVPATAFADTVGSSHRAAIDCAAWWGLTSGRTPNEFGPGDPIRRGQTAAMVARLLRGSGAAPADVPTAGFADTVGHPFERDIDLLVHLGIVAGASADRFAPDRPIQRDQMATIVAAMFANGYDAALPETPEEFTDVAPDNVHRAAIGRIAAAGITTGLTTTTYGPERSVSRAEMSSFLTRSAARLVAGSHAAPPTERPAADDPYHAKMRGAWVNIFEDTLKSRAGIIRMLDELAAADANVVLAQVIRRHDAYYESDVLPRTADPDLPEGFDVLAELIPEAHARGIEVHAWYSVAPTWHPVYEDLPAPEGWLTAEHGRQAPEADRWVTRYSTPDGWRWSDYLDLGLPEVQAHVEAVVAEIAARYPVDGIHLDYVRYESERHGFHPRAVQRFQEETGTTTFPAADDRAWTDWRRARSREVIVRAGRAIAASGRDIDLSAAVITWAPGPPTPDRSGFQRTRAYTQVLQDWDGWVRQGLVDAVMPMNYFQADLTWHLTELDRWIDHQARLTAEAAARIVPGPGGYLNTPSATLDHIATAMRRTNGAVIFSYNQPTKDGSREIWSRLGGTRWFYPPARR